VRGRTYATAVSADAEALLELKATGLRAPAARKLAVTAVRNPVAWTAAVESAAMRLRAGEAAKVVLAREVLARGDGVVSAAMVARSLRAAYPSCFTYLITGADGTAFAGASPELLVRRSGGRAFAQPMAGSVARGATDAEDERLAWQLEDSAKDAVEHRIVSEFVIDALRPFSQSVAARAPEVVRFTNIQHLATSVAAELSVPPADVLQLADDNNIRLATNVVTLHLADGRSVQLSATVLSKTVNAINEGFVRVLTEGGAQSPV
jgi:isochorismate synthase EntC